MCRRFNSGSRVFTRTRLAVAGVHSCSCELSRGRLVVVGFILVRLSSFTRAYSLPSSLGFAWVNLGEPRVRTVHSSSRGFTRRT